jgi:2-hydroxy fatty acid dioxygenase
MAILGFNFNLLDQLTFYGSYHANKWNQLIHFFFVPLILGTASVWLCATGPLWSVELPGQASALLPSYLARYGLISSA